MTATEQTILAPAKVGDKIGDSVGSIFDPQKSIAFHATITADERWVITKYVGGTQVFFNYPVFVFDDELEAKRTADTLNRVAIDIRNEVMAMVHASMDGIKKKWSE